ncbi:MAG: hypothetical protein HQK77_17610 [Desulfobacterales bacterium]|nr:hypothetical protein [Desulfobacterales bacterium]
MVVNKISLNNKIIFLLICVFSLFLTTAINAEESDNGSYNSPELILQAVNDVITVLDEILPIDSSGAIGEAFITSVNTSIEVMDDIFVAVITLSEQHKDIPVDTLMLSINAMAKLLTIINSMNEEINQVDTEYLFDAFVMIDDIINIVLYYPEGVETAQLFQMIEDLNSIMDDLTDILEYLTIESVLIFFDVVETVIAIGIDTICSTDDSNIDIAQELKDMIDTLDEMIIETMDNPQDIDRILKKTGELFIETVESLMKCSDQNVFNEVIEIVKDEVSAVIDEIHLQLKEPNSYNSDANYVAELLDYLSDIASIFPNKELSLNSNILNSSQGLVGQAIDNIIQEYLQKIQVDPQDWTDDGQITSEELKNNPHLLDKLVTSYGLNVVKGVQISQEKIIEALSEDYDGASPEELQNLAQRLPPLPRPDQVLVKFTDSSGNQHEISVIEAVTQYLQEKLGLPARYQIDKNGTASLIISTGNPSVTGESTELKLPLYISTTRFVSANMPEGLHNLPDGSFLFIRNGLASFLNPAPYDASGVINALQNLGLSSSLNQDGLLDVSLTPEMNTEPKTLSSDRGMSIVGSFGYGTRQLVQSSPSRSLSSNRGQVLFEARGTNPASEDYRMIVRFIPPVNRQATDEHNVVEQDFVPMMFEMEQFKATLNKMYGKKYVIDTNTGVLNLFDLGKYKIDYVFYSYSEKDKLDYEALVSTKQTDEFGTYLKKVDVNLDGLMDMEVWTKSGYQLLYAIQK